MHPQSVRCACSTLRTRELGVSPSRSLGTGRQSPLRREAFWGPELRLVWAPTSSCDPQVSNSRPAISCSFCITNSQSPPGMEAPRLASAVRADTLRGRESPSEAPDPAEPPRVVSQLCGCFLSPTLLGTQVRQALAWDFRSLDQSRGWSNSAEDRTVCAGAHGPCPRPGLSQEGFLEEAPCPLSPPLRG
ncbi:unnamed protein product [Rangifer tarandus platyrhynchus]|uniref:Uncharacterized protein n=1 Tax=Rangifer tarandus platyrhynchus TaxID=3082113 RepID=A0AC59YBN5_RANTA